MPSDRNREKEFELTDKLKLKLPGKAKMKNLVKLKEVGVDIENAELINRTRSTMIQDLEKTKIVAESIFNRVFTKTEIEELDPIVVREALDYFLEKKCGIVFQETKK